MDKTIYDLLLYKNEVKDKKIYTKEGDWFYYPNDTNPKSFPGGYRPILNTLNEDKIFIQHSDFVVSHNRFEECTIEHLTLDNILTYKNLLEHLINKTEGVKIKNRQQLINLLKTDELVVFSDYLHNDSCGSYYGGSPREQYLIFKINNMMFTFNYCLSCNLLGFQFNEWVKKKYKLLFEEKKVRHGMYINVGTGRKLEPDNTTRLVRVLNSI